MDFTFEDFGFIQFPWGQTISFHYPETTGVTASFRINDLGTVVGIYFDQNGVDHGFARSLGGHFTPVDDPAAMGTGTFPFGVNDRG